MRNRAYLSVSLVAAFLFVGCTETSAEKRAGAMTVSQATALSLACTSCHLGEDASGAMPSLVGWTPADLRASLRDYKSDEGGHTVMHRLMRGYSDEEINLIADYIGQDFD